MELNKDTIKYLEKQAQKKAFELAHEAQERLATYYILLISKYYNDYTPKYYIRTHNLYNSFNLFYKNSHGNILYGGIAVGADKMHDNYDELSPSELMSNFIYAPSATYHGRYDIKASFSIYQEIHNYHEWLKEYYRKRCTI